MLYSLGSNCDKYVLFKCKCCETRHYLKLVNCNLKGVQNGLKIQGFRLNLNIRSEMITFVLSSRAMHSVVIISL